MEKGNDGKMEKWKNACHSRMLLSGIPVKI